MRPAIGPDAARYLHAGAGHPVPRPFHLRWLLPEVCGEDVRWWWRVWAGSWVWLAGATFCWSLAAGMSWQRSAACVALLLGLPGIIGPRVVIPVGVDLPATALAVTAAAFTVAGDRWIVAGVIVALWAGTIKETGPVVAALAAWSPWPLIGLLAPAVRHLWCVRRDRIGADPLGEKFQALLDHPVRAAMEAHSGRWRDAWLMVAPWGVCLVALHDPTWPVVVALVVAYAQLVVATDTVRLVHHVAGPTMAAAAAAQIPMEWLLLACVVHVVWWWRMERV